MDKRIEELVEHVNEADAILVGAGSGMSNAAGMDFWYENSSLLFQHIQGFQEIYDKYHFEGIFNGLYNRFDSESEHWAFLLRSVKMITSVLPQKDTYEYLKTLVANKPTHFVTTNQDGLFKHFFPQENISEIQGSWEFFQSKNTQTDTHLYKSAELLKNLLPKIKNNELPEEDIPKSPVNGAELIPWARGPEFLEDKRYHDEYQKVNNFIGEHRNEKILFIEMGVGRMTPMFIQEPFWEMTHYFSNSTYININPKDAIVNPQIKERSLLIDDDINEVLKAAASMIKGDTND